MDTMEARRERGGGRGGLDLWRETNPFLFFF